MVVHDNIVDNLSGAMCVPGGVLSWDIGPRIGARPQATATGPGPSHRLTGRFFYTYIRHQTSENGPALNEPVQHIAVHEFIYICRNTIDNNAAICISLMGYELERKCPGRGKTQGGKDQCMYVCMYVWMDACMHACMHVCMHVYVCMRVCVYACMYVCMYACVYVCMHVCVCM